MESDMNQQQADVNVQLWRLGLALSHTCAVLGIQPQNFRAMDWSNVCDVQTNIRILHLKHFNSLSHFLVPIQYGEVFKSLLRGGGFGG